jgi:hypothetical protein
MHLLYIGVSKWRSHTKLEEFPDMIRILWEATYALAEFVALASGKTAGRQRRNLKPVPIA